MEFLLPVDGAKAFFLDETEPGLFGFWNPHILCSGVGCACAHTHPHTHMIDRDQIGQDKTGQDGGHFTGFIIGSKDKTGSVLCVA